MQWHPFQESTWASATHQTSLSRPFPHYSSCSYSTLSIGLTVRHCFVLPVETPRKVIATSGICLAQLWSQGRISSWHHSISHQLCWLASSATSSFPSRAGTRSSSGKRRHTLSQHYSLFISSKTLCCVQVKRTISCQSLHLEMILPRMAVREHLQRQSLSSPTDAHGSWIIYSAIGLVSCSALSSERSSSLSYSYRRLCLWSLWDLYWSTRIRN